MTRRKETAWETLV